MRSYSRKILGWLLLCAFTASGCAHRTLSIGTELDNGQIRVSDKMIVRVKEGKRDYTALIAVDATKGGSFARAEVRNSATHIVLFDGYLYIWGDSPMGATKNVAAAATGTTMVFELLPDRERVYLLAMTNDETATVRLAAGTVPAPGSKTGFNLGVNTYVECVYAPGGQLKLVAPQPIPAGGPIITFLNKVRDDVQAAGLGGWPSPWPSP